MEPYDWIINPDMVFKTRRKSARNKQHLLIKQLVKLLINYEIPKRDQSLCSILASNFSANFSQYQLNICE